jgi:hypothetical protein
MARCIPKAWRSWIEECQINLKAPSQTNAIDIIDHIIEKFSFGIGEVLTDNGHEF